MIVLQDEIYLAVQKSDCIVAISAGSRHDGIDPLAIHLNPSVLRALDVSIYFADGEESFERFYIEIAGMAASVVCHRLYNVQ